MKTNSVVATVVAILVIILLQACAGESLTITSTTVDNITYFLDNEKAEATATGYVIKDGSVNKRLLLPNEIEAVNTHFTVTSVSDGAFINGPWESVEICSSIKSLGSKAFAGCNGIEAVTLYGTIAPTINDDTFDKETYQNAILVIRRDCNIEGSHWLNFTNIVKN